VRIEKNNNNNNWKRKNIKYENWKKILIIIIIEKEIKTFRRKRNSKF